MRKVLVSCGAVTKGGGGAGFFRGNFKVGSTLASLMYFMTLTSTLINIVLI